MIVVLRGFLNIAAALKEQFRDRVHDATGRSGQDRLRTLRSLIIDSVWHRWPIGALQAHRSDLGVTERVRRRIDSAAP